MSSQVVTRTLPTNEIRLAITGAGGWLGRELIGSLANSQDKITVLPLGRRDGQVSLGNLQYQVHEWKSDTLPGWQPTHIVHLACRTREHLQNEPEIGASENSQLLARLLSEMRRLPLRGVMIASSGAATMDHPDAYGDHKRVEEEAVRSLAYDLNMDAIVARIWSVTGRFCTKPEQFLFFDLLRQGIDSKTQELKLSGPRMIARRYVDGGEFLSACLRELLNGQSATIDSGGELVTSIGLAERIRDIVSPEKLVVHHFVDPEVDSYASVSDGSSELARHSGLTLSSLNDQIITSIPAVTK